MSWDAERVSQLKSLWISGLSASQIARKMGGGISRNAVIGKVHRLGLSGRGQPKATIREKRVARPAAAAPEPRSAPPPPAPEQKSATPTLSNVEQAGHNQAAIMDLSERRCRWPLGDPEDSNFKFCGGEVEPGSPYCTEHSRMAYQPAPRRASA